MRNCDREQHIMKKTTRKLLIKYESAITNATRRTLMSASGWAADIPHGGGVYVIWQSNTPIYVGESSSLRARMSDIGRPATHTFARKTCKALRIPVQASKRLAVAMRARYKLTFITVELGRAEVEEYLILRWRKTLTNKPAKRLLRSPQYAWVKEIP